MADSAAVLHSPGPADTNGGKAAGSAQQTPAAVAGIRGSEHAKQIVSPALSEAPLPAPESAVTTAPTTPASTPASTPAATPASGVIRPGAPPTPGTAKGKGGRKAANPHLSDDERKRERVLKNRESAMKSLQKKKRYTESLESRAAMLSARNADLKAKIRRLLDRIPPTSAAHEYLAALPPLPDDLLPALPRGIQQAILESGQKNAADATAAVGMAQRQAPLQSVMVPQPQAHLATEYIGAGPMIGQAPLLPHHQSHPAGAQSQTNHLLAHSRPHLQSQGPIQTLPQSDSIMQNGAAQFVGLDATDVMNSSPMPQTQITTAAAGVPNAGVPGAGDPGGVAPDVLLSKLAATQPAITDAFFGNLPSDTADLSALLPFMQQTPLSPGCADAMETTPGL